MGFLTRFTQGELRLTRLEAFSDGVFAIIVTLLVLELKVPALHDRTSVRELAQQLLTLLPKFLSWLISFIIVCKFWLHHHRFLGLARHANYAMVWLNSLNALAVSLFGVVMAVKVLAGSAPGLGLVAPRAPRCVAPRLSSPPAVGIPKVSASSRGGGR